MTAAHIDFYAAMGLGIRRQARPFYRFGFFMILSSSLAGS
jgi:hypothetical protein